MRARKRKNTPTRMENCSDIWVKDYKNHKGKWNILFGNQNPIHLEIGCGKGDFVLGMAKLYPDINFVAVEKFPDVIVLAMEKIKSAELKNVLFISADAKELCETFKKGEVERIYLNFSDPWPRNKNSKRRLTHENFLNIYKKLLRKGQFIYFKTDNKKLFEFSLNEFCRCNFLLQNISLDLHNSNMENNVMTEYEKNFSEKGFPIYRLEAMYK
ncbi:MAG: tRNA (guanosine(46)-N7)-methyltransferase TrmB [Clostridia bacterium]|nr:tRNA (guanosine(46)-N7)-methyltransferase TrmB [Clostridia bacterium]